MAVRTANDAFADFRVDPINGKAARDKLANRRYFGATDMIEFEDYPVPLSTIDASVRLQIFLDVAPCAISVQLSVSSASGPVTVAIISVVRSTVDVLAVSATPVAYPI
jgi:hypothetical protein